MCVNLYLREENASMLATNAKACDLDGERVRRSLDNFASRLGKDAR
jgi:hypothetical protein